VTLAPHEQLPHHDRPPDAELAGARVRRARTAPPWWFALPALLLFAFVVLAPSARGVYHAFTDWDGLDPCFSFVGLDNFSHMLRDPDAMQAIGHTLLIAGSITVIQNALGLLLALGVNTAIKPRNVLRVSLFAPAVITPIVTAYLWRNLWGPGGAVSVLPVLPALLVLPVLPALPDTGYAADPSPAELSTFIRADRTVPFMDRLWPNAKVRQTMLSGLQEIFSGQSTPKELLDEMDADYKAGS
jgi:ABC-type sugar transport system permease subunit